MSDQWSVLVVDDEPPIRAELLHLDYLAFPQVEGLHKASVSQFIPTGDHSNSTGFAAKARWTSFAKSSLSIFK